MCWRGHTYEIIEQLNVQQIWKSGMTRQILRIVSRCTKCGKINHYDVKGK